jgi:phosphatidylglycerophosphate synthase
MENSGNAGVSLTALADVVVISLSYYLLASSAKQNLWHCLMLTILIFVISVSATVAILISTCLYLIMIAVPKFKFVKEQILTARGRWDDS